MSNGITTILLVVATTILIALGISAFDNDPEPVYQPATETPQEVTAEPEVDTTVKDLERFYMEGCVEGSTDPEIERYCSCTFDYLENVYTVDEFIDISVKVERGDITLDNLPIELENAVFSCLEV